MVKINETYCGGEESNKHEDNKIKDIQDRSTKTKTIIIEVVKRKDNIFAKIVGNTKGNTIKLFDKRIIKITT